MIGRLLAVAGSAVAMSGMVSAGALAQSAGAPFSLEDAAARFGAREGVSDISLSPDGTRIAYIAPGTGQANTLWTVELGAGDAPASLPKRAIAADGKPLRLRKCGWVSNTRLLCEIFSYRKGVDGIVVDTKLIAANADGTELKMVSARRGSDALYTVRFGGNVVDWLPGQDGAVLVGRYFVPEARVGSLLEKRDEGYGVERVDTRSGKSTAVESARRDAVEYLSDGRGTIRIMGMQPTKVSGYAGGIVNYFYRLPTKREWLPMNSYDVRTREGFNPLAVDAARNLVYGLKKKDGRQALYSVALDGSLKGELVFAHPQVDVDDVVRIGHDRRVVGATFATDRRDADYFDPEVAAMAASLGRSLPNLPQKQVLDSSGDGSRMLVWAGNDADPGQYFVFDRSKRKLHRALQARPQMDGVALANVKPVRFATADGSMVPAYLTLPPGSDGRKLPAIVLPHGGPEARDEWGFDWLAQFYANRGYAVLQPNYRGSTGYGDAWFQNNGFKSWRTAVGDVVDAGRWLVTEGIADPAKLGIVGWSYGGYAALQSNVVAPDLFKAVVAIAPVTDFAMTIEEARGYANFALERERVGTGSHLRAGSPAQNADAFKAPVLLFHGEYDANVGIRQSRLMAERLKSKGRTHELIVYPGLTHQIDDSDARADMLARSDRFLRSAMGLKTTEATAVGRTPGSR